MSSLDSQLLSRKERLAQLRNLKRKRDGDAEEGAAPESDEQDDDGEQKRPVKISQRNYDADAHAPRQGFLEPPTAKLDVPTVEEEAARIERELNESRPKAIPTADDEDTEAAAENDDERPDLVAHDEEEDENQLDPSELQPRAVNWDLKRQIADKLEILQRKTEIAINRIVRERVKAQSGVSGVEGEGAMPAGDLNKAVDSMEKQME
ncbi:mRNA splicing factor [Limtongia smithiae]|uniref:mRNA splicing factor n=1 Tax=Limtongia smithiae TaxID=1125753 RepID=UPI0034CD1FCA